MLTDCDLGRRRNIRHLWAFLLLGQTVGISLAMNLFFLAVLLTPVPLPTRSITRTSDSTTRKRPSFPFEPTRISQAPENTHVAVQGVIPTFKALLPPLITRPHPPEWTPHPYAIIAPLAILYASVFLLLFSTSTPQFGIFLVIPYLILFRPLYLDRLAPVAYGSTQHPHRTYLAVYRFLSYTSFLLYLKQTVVATLDNDPGSYEHRHSHFLASLHLPHERERGAISRTTRSISHVLGALGDHPAVTSVGWDVLMCAISLAVWAVVRGLNISKIASAAGLTTVSAKDHDNTSKEYLSRTRPASLTSSARRVLSTKQRRNRKPPDRSGKAAEQDDDFAPSEADHPILLGEEEEPENGEAGAVSWAMFALGGLGVLASGVLGAESES